MFLHGIHLECADHFAIRHIVYAVLCSRYTDKFFNVRIPRCNILVAYGPVYTVIEALRTGKFIITPPLRLPGPQQGLAPDLVPSYPLKRFLLYIVLFASMH